MQRHSLTMMSPSFRHLHYISVDSCILNRCTCRNRPVFINKMLNPSKNVQNICCIQVQIVSNAPHTECDLLRGHFELVVLRFEVMRLLHQTYVDSGVGGVPSTG